MTGRIKQDLLGDQRSPILLRISVTGRKRPISEIHYNPVDLRIEMDIDDQLTEQFHIARDFTWRPAIEKKSRPLVGMIDIFLIRGIEILELPIKHPAF
jgi:hypothetical protein